ncbi:MULTISPECIES: MJ0042-type zinc finger domain-containing protein [Pirellulaceae]|uniref:MJ0042-type zinc finger domain-containing protein n=1 Tax=Pirellulaceae TaxID=2691357 RepID=UPI001304B60E|nr:MULTISPECIES: MJ0042-type zinc finger domain-containing protein [Pirellulaceae]
MTAIAKCTNCDSAFKVKDHLVGKAVRCPRCGEPFRVASGGSRTTIAPKVSESAGNKTLEGEAGDSSVNSSSPDTLSAESSADAFFDTHEDVDALYAANVTSARQRKQRRQMTVLIGSGCVAAILLIVGTVIAFQYAYDKNAIPLELADPRVVDTENLNGTWRPYSDTHWGYTVRMPGDPRIQTEDEDQIRTLTLKDQEFGTLRVEFRKESHPEWNEFFAKVERDEIFQGVPAGNVMKISSDVTYRTDSVAVHRYILVSKDSRLTKDVAVVCKFSAKGKTITAMWSGKREMLRSPEVLYFFSSLEISGDRYITH